MLAAADFSSSFLFQSHYKNNINSKACKMSLGGLLICICCAVKYLNFFMWTVVKSFIRRMGVFEVSPKYICNILFLWYGISAQVNSPEQLTQLSEISWYVYFQFAALLVNVLKFLQGFHRKWVLPRTVFAGGAEKSLGKQWKCGTGTPWFHHCTCRLLGLKFTIILVPIPLLGLGWLQCCHLVPW